MKFDENLAAVHAYLCSDGYVIKNPPTQKQKYYCIGLRNTNLTLLKDFQKRFFEYFGVEPRLRIGERCVIQRKELYELLVSEFKSFYSREWQMPKLNKKLTAIWLRAAFDCEGWVYCKTHQNRHIGLEVVNKKGINQIRFALKSLGINSKLNKRKGRNTFALHIYGKDNLVKFDKKVGFLHPAKKKKLQEAIKDYMNYYWEYPVSKTGLKTFIKELMLSKAKIKKENGVIFLISNKKINLVKLQKLLVRYYNIEPRFNKRKNGIGTIYFQLDINKQKQIKKLIRNNLINEEEKQKWLSLKKNQI